MADDLTQLLLRQALANASITPADALILFESCIRGPRPAASGEGEAPPLGIHLPGPGPMPAEASDLRDPAERNADRPPAQLRR